MNKIYPSFIPKKLLIKVVEITIFLQLKISILQNFIKKLTEKKKYEQHRSQ